MRNNYTISEFITTAYAYILTKIFYRNSRLIRRPVYIRGKSSLELGSGLTLGHHCRFDLPGKKKTLFIGDHCEFGDNVHIGAYEKVIIGSNVLMASKIYISDTSHGTYKGVDQDSPLTKPNDRALKTTPVEIGDNVWLGENVVVLPGVHIGKGCIVGANSVVTRNLPDYTIAAGVPAKVIKVWEATGWISNSIH